MRGALWYILWCVYVPCALILSAIFLIVCLPYVVCGVIHEKWQAQRAGRKVNWRIFGGA